ncbi:alpha/beta fold hydrolase [Corynebacterium liangguodongii]|uniref:Alpha/beta hydrolase n=1 Tax=Corynebacterium liangguodongii TaxID=2079535 RepID=A0A2S0WBM9_9CORY|nr:alpha/beta fold hydrolase [Corynebacterium liangguodongii]AWB83082.1 alpha/beta hydrolase [Corynebacterium liangguodongii]PWB99317.1 alpha/beta hydrolase [Corynebacterium liangguodongii]
MATTEVEISLPDGSTSTVLLYPAQQQEHPLVVIWPGFGMGAHYYRPIAQWLADRGYPTAIGELRGQGSSTAVATRAHTWSYHTMASEDYPLTISAAKEAFGLGRDYPVVLLSHSMGGQIGTLFLSSPAARALNVRGLMGVGAGSPYWKAFDGKTRRTLRVGATLMDAVSRVMGYWPAGPLDIANYGRQARAHVAEWARLSRTNSVAHIAGEDYVEALLRVTVPVLYTRFNNDDDCTLASADALAMHVPSAHPRVEQLEGGLGHNRWAREPEVVGRRLIRFVEEELGA